MKQLIVVLALFLFSAWPVHLSAKVVLKSASQLELTERYDNSLNPSMQKQLDSYKRRMEKSVTRKIGTVSKRMLAGRPESTLSNFLADQLLEKARTLSSEQVDVCVINIGGIRASLNKGELTVEDIYKVLPFEDQVVILTLSGKDLLSLFQYVAGVGGEGLSGVRLTCKDKKVTQATINDKPIDAQAAYTVATLTYLAQGNGGFAVLLRATETKTLNRTARECIIEQIEQLTAEGKPIRGNLDGRISFMP